MANPISEASILATIADKAPQALVHTIQKKSQLFDMVKKVTIDSKAWQWQAMISDNDSVETVDVGGDVSDGDAADNTQANVFTENYHGAIRFPHKELVLLLQAGDALKIADYMVNQTANLAQQIANLWNTHIISGLASAGQMIGLTSAGGWISNTGSPGIDRAIYATWQCLVQNAGGAAVTEALVRTLLNTFEDSNADGMDLENGTFALISNRANHDLIKAFSGSVNLMQEVMPGEPPTKVIGYRKIEFDGVPVLRIKQYTANRVDLLDFSGFEFGYIPGLTMNESGVGTPNGTPFHFLPPQWSGQNVVFHVMSYTATRLTNPSKQAASLVNLSV